MGGESSGMVGFDLGPLLEGQMRTACEDSCISSFHQYINDSIILIYIFYHVKLVHGIVSNKLSSNSDLVFEYEM